MNIRKAIARCVEREDLLQDEARAVMGQIMAGDATSAQIAGYAIALRMKGETVAELTGSAQAMRDHAVRVSVPVSPLIDTCGTGGDGRGTFNISTTAAFVVAACGVTVAKHGNRSISSRCGSADLLTGLGVEIDCSTTVIEKCLREVGIGFLFAPNHHGAMKHAAAPRVELGVRTFFNLLGPLTNPAAASCQLLGVFDGRWTEPLAMVLGRLGLKRAMVVHGMDGLDEITTTDATQVSELKGDGSVVTYRVEPSQWGVARAVPGDLDGGDIGQNVAITRDILGGKTGPGRDIVVINAGAALYVADVAPDIRTGMVLAARAIDSGEAKRRMEHLVTVSGRKGMSQSL